MKKIDLVILIIFYSFICEAQNLEKNSLTTSILRLEKNSQSMHGFYHLKFITGIHYQRRFNKWRFGLKYEHGFNEIDETNPKCWDCFYGTGYLKENNVFLTSNYSLFNLFDSKLQFRIGMDIYYSNINYYGYFSGGFSGGGKHLNSFYNTFGFSPNISIKYTPTSRLFFSLDASNRFGWSSRYEKVSDREKIVKEFVVTAPEFKIGVTF